MNTDYLAFEGVDGSGKTSYIEALSSHLEKKSINFKIVREPGGSKLGEGIRDLLLSHEYSVEPLTEALLFSANRANLISEIIKPSIENGIKIISDRSAYSSVAYQGVGRGLGFDKIYEINETRLDLVTSRSEIQDSGSEKHLVALLRSKSQTDPIKTFHAPKSFQLVLLFWVLAGASRRRPAISLQASRQFPPGSNFFLDPVV